MSDSTTDVSRIQELLLQKEREQISLRERADSLDKVIEAYRLVIHDLKAPATPANNKASVEEQREKDVSQLLSKTGMVHVATLSNLWGISMEGATQWMKKRVDRIDSKWFQDPNNGRIFIKKLPPVTDSSMW